MCRNFLVCYSLLFIFAFSLYAIGEKSKILPTPRSRSFSSVSFYKFYSFRLYLKHLIHELIFMSDVWEYPISFFFMWISSFLSIVYWTVNLFPIVDSYFLCLKIVDHVCVGLFQSFYLFCLVFPGTKMFHRKYLSKCWCNIFFLQEHYRYFEWHSYISSYYSCPALQISSSIPEPHSLKFSSIS